jgi:hypothetical protein
MAALAKLIDVLNGKTKKITPLLIQSLLDVSPEYAPDKDCFELGLMAFRKEYSDDIPLQVRSGHIMNWGTQFWKEKLDEREIEVLDEEEDEQEEIEEGWTPERVLKALKRVIRIGAFQMRRARWFCRLSESNISWSNADNNNKDKHVLLIKSGAPIFGNHNLPPFRTNFPQGYQKTKIDRQACFDIPTYDRMRIITTELRRIIQESRDVTLCLHPGNKLNKEQLEKILKWV